MAEDNVMTGFDDLFAKLDKLPSLVSAKTALVRAARKGGKPIRDAARSAAPRSDEAPHMADTIVVIVAEQTIEGVTILIGPSKKGFYGYFLEFGFGRMAANPFLRPAFDTNVDKAVEIIRTELASQITRAMML